MARRDQEQGTRAFQWNADDGLDGLVRPAVPLVVEVAEGILVDEGQRRAAELAGPIRLEALALVLGQEVRRRQEARLRVAFPEHGGHLPRAPPPTPHASYHMWF